MTRFAAQTPAERRQLIVDAIVAHRERASAFLTIEADPTALEDASDVDTDLGIPWVQFADGIVSIDCTDAELERLKSLLPTFPAFKIDELVRPEDAEGTHARISAKADPNRIAQFCEAIFLRVYQCPEDSRLWVTAV